MALIQLSAAERLPRLAEFDTIVDARSENEFALDRLPGAVNWPTLNNLQRHEVGWRYKQVHPFEARKLGAAMAARNIAEHITQHVLERPRHWKPLVYCWRGGQRSGALALVLAQIGFTVTVVQGGYKAFRTAMLADTVRLCDQFGYRIVCGATGSGKTRLLQALDRAGAQVLDLEGLANHRSSVLGAIPGLVQPCQKAFDTRVWDRLRGFDARQPVFVESESRKIGNVAVPAVLIEAMRQRGRCLNLVLSDAQRVALLLEDYDFFVRDSAAFSERLDALVELRGKAQVQRWKASIQDGDLVAVVRELLTVHYDPLYQQSIRRNFHHYAQATTLVAPDRSPQAMDALAATLLR